MGGRRLATPGAVVFLVGVVLIWWGSGVFRDKSKTFGSGGGGSAVYSPPSQNSQSPTTPGGGSAARRM